jgi:hypothetical protein
LAKTDSVHVRQGASRGGIILALAITYDPLPSSPSVSIATQPIMAFHSMLPANNPDYEHQKHRSVSLSRLPGMGNVFFCFDLLCESGWE